MSDNGPATAGLSSLLSRLSSIPMYKLLLIRKYLLKRRIAWVSLLAVTLCTAMVLVVISVMGGWLRMFQNTFQGVTGDVVVTTRSLAGFEGYEEIIERIERLPQVSAAVPVIKTWGLVNIDNQIIDGVQVIGVPIERIGLVNEFPKSLYRQYNQPIAEGREPPATPSFDLIPGIPYESFREGGSRYPGMIVSAGLVGIGRDAKGEMKRPAGLYQAWARLEVLPIQPDSITIQNLSSSPRLYWIVDDSRTKLWQLDQRTVYVPFDVLQRDLDMAARTTDDIDVTTGQPYVASARATEIQIDIKPGTDPAAMVEPIREIVTQVTGDPLVNGGGRLNVQTWQQAQAIWLAAIEKEVILVTMLFGIISLVAVFLIFVIFYMIVVEKTRDIGIIKSVGATNAGVAGIFLGYGLAIGVVGAGLGFAVALAIVRNINYLHEKMGQLLNVQIWDPQVYQFDTIPNTMDPRTVSMILITAVIAALMGAGVPAIRAARGNPVEALRFE